MKNIPEILSPVGGFEQLMAAVENGADAVYLGGEFFNARIKADNFDLENMVKAVSYAHIRNVKVYVTMNTLLYDDELEIGVEYAKKMYLLGVDALILQDTGLTRLVRKYIPEMKIHLSTQGSVYNLSGAEQARELGFERVVLARETSLEEIKTICAAKALEIEVFVHGALCMCYSGQCQLSRNMGGRSGNRGLCAQPCRLPFETGSGRAYPLSTKDLSGIDYLKELSEAGVASIKIEGRMKSPEYVAIVTGIYRKYLDIYKNEGNYQVSESDRQALAQVFSRGGFTTGYLFGNPGDDLLSGVLPKHQGTYMGTVTNGDAGRGLITIRLDEGKTLSLGDGVEIHNQELSGNVITYIKETDNGDLCIGDLKGEMQTGDLVFKITDRTLMEKARATYKENSWEAFRSLKKTDIEMEFKARFDGHPALTIREMDGMGAVRYEVTVTGEDKAEKAINRPLTEEKVCDQLGKTGDTTFNVIKMVVCMEEGISLPLSALNKLRRDGLSKLAQEKSKGREDNRIWPGYKFSGKPGESLVVLPILELYFYSVEDFSSETVEGVLAELEKYKLRFNEIRVLLPVCDMLDSRFSNDEKQGKITVMPYIPTITKGKGDAFIRENFDNIIKRCRETGIYIGNLGWIDEFKKAGVKISADFGLNINNVEGENWAEEQGFISFVPSLESFDGEENSNWIYEGAIPLMITEHPIAMNLTEPKRGMGLKAEYQENIEKSILVKIGEIDYKRIKESMDTRQRNVRIFMD